MITDLFLVPLKVHFLHANYNLAADLVVCALTKYLFASKLETHFDGHVRKHFKTNDFCLNTFFKVSLLQL